MYQSVDPLLKLRVFAIKILKPKSIPKIDYYFQEMSQKSAGHTGLQTRAWTVPGSIQSSNYSVSDFGRVIFFLIGLDYDPRSST